MTRTIHKTEQPVVLEGYQAVLKPSKFGYSLSALRFSAPIALIHDSVLCRATDMSMLSSIVRETYMHLFAEHDYLNDFASQIGAETAPPIVGDLKPESVIESTYFFC